MAVSTQEIMQLVVERQPELIFVDKDTAGSRGDEICCWIKQDAGLQQTAVIMIVDCGDLEADQCHAYQVDRTDIDGQGRQRCRDGRAGSGCRTHRTVMMVRI